MTADSANAGVLVERCEQCGRVAALARGFCAVCGSHDLSPRVIGGDGNVWSITTLHSRRRDGDPESGTFGIALVVLDAGIRLMVRAPVDLRIGDRVELARPDLHQPASLVQAIRERP